MESNFANRLRELMDIYGLKQADIVERIHIPKSSLSMYLKGTRSPKQDTIFALSEAFNVEPAWLIGYDIHMEKISSENLSVEDAKLDARFSNDKELKESIKIYYSLPEEKRAEIRRYISFVANN